MTRSRFAIKISHTNIKYYEDRITGMIIWPEMYVWSNGHIEKEYRIYTKYPETYQEYESPIATYYHLKNARKYIMEGGE